MRIFISILGLILTLCAAATFAFIHNTSLAAVFLAASTLVYSLGRTSDGNTIQALNEKNAKLSNDLLRANRLLNSWKLHAEILEKRLDKCQE
jgi:hypothetical protein